MSSLVHNFQQFNVKAAVAHHPTIQKEVDELLAKGVTEPSSGGAGFYSSMFVVPKHTGGLQPILNLRHFNHYMHIPFASWGYIGILSTCQYLYLLIS